ncbi:DedA family protein [Candidatus Berkelbacteria bacterium]|nr:DedA family protein [Candidatus Berkelbacteria bacterium]
MDDLLRYFLHLDSELVRIIAQYGSWTYAILFAVIFVETGLVIMPFLPGDSLLFTAGAIAASGALNLWLLIALLFVAAVLGDSANYWIGAKLGEAAFRRWPRIFKPEYLKETHAFYERYGGKTIVLARFVPIVRTFAPFVAGVGKMSYGSFLAYNLTGAALWAGGVTLLGYLFGNIPIVRENLTITLLGIVIVSTIPMITEYLRHRSR